MISPESNDPVTAAHDQKMTHSYVVHFPDHAPRTSDPHYKDFDAIHRAWKADPERWQCAVGKHRNDFSECDTDHPLELHHSHIEFSLQNGVDLKWLEVDYPGVSNPDEVGAWVESADNLEVLCVFHHRASGGKHTAAFADFEAEQYVKKLIGG